MANKYIITNIEWDADKQTKKTLPKEVVVNVPDEEHTCYEDIEQYISDELSNVTGYCHEGFATTPEIPQ